MTARLIGPRCECGRPVVPADEPLGFCISCLRLVGRVRAVWLACERIWKEGRV